MASDSVGWIGRKMMRTPLVPVAALGLLAAFVFVWRLGDRDLWAPDETRNAQIAREMVVSGSWGVPSLNGVAWTEQPPLHVWLVAAACVLTGGDNEVSVRLPGAFSAVITVLLFFLVGRHVLGVRASILAGAVFATAVGAIGGARVAVPDMTFAMFLALAMLSLLRAREDGSAWWFVATAFAVGGGMLSGGVAAALVPFAAVSIHAAATRRATPFFAAGAVMAVLSGAAVCMGVLALAARGTPELPRMIAAQFASFARLEDGLAIHFLWVVPVALLPWVFFLPGAIAQFVKDADARRGTPGYLMAWGAAALAWACVFGSRNYLLALAALPPAAALVGMFWEFCLAVDATERLRYRVGLPFLAFVLALPVAGFVLYGQTREAFPQFGGVAMGYGSALIFLASVLVIFIFWRQTFCRFASVGVSSLIAVGFAVVFVVPKINEVKSEKPFFYGVRARVPAGSELRTLCMPDASRIYYSGRARIPNIQSEEDLKAYLSSSGEVYCIMEYDDYLTHRVRGLEKLTLLFKERAGRKTLAVVTNRPR